MPFWVLVDEVKGQMLMYRPSSELGLQVRLRWRAPSWKLFLTVGRANVRRTAQQP
jgi:hypothetical protein